MPALLIILLVIGGLVVIGIIALRLARPWYMRWGATDEEVKKQLPGDDLKPIYERIRTRGITIHATPAQIYPWLVQMGQGRGGLYSLEWLENLVGLQFKNADRIHPEWQVIKIGDLVRMGPDGKAPPPYEVAAIYPDRALILGHQEKDGRWFDTWQFVLEPLERKSTRLVIRSRYDLWHNFFDAIVEPITFIMERGLMYGIKERVEENK